MFWGLLGKKEEEEERGTKMGEEGGGKEVLISFFLPSFLLLPTPNILENKVLNRWWCERDGGLGVAFITIVLVSPNMILFFYCRRLRPPVRYS